MSAKFVAFELINKGKYYFSVVLFSLKCDDREGHRFCEVDIETIFTVALFN